MLQVYREQKLLGNRFWRQNVVMLKVPMFSASYRCLALLINVQRQLSMFSASYRCLALVIDVQRQLSVREKSLTINDKSKKSRSFGIFAIRNFGCTSTLLSFRIVGCKNDFNNLSFNNIEQYSFQMLYHNQLLFIVKFLHSTQNLI